MLSSGQFEIKAIKSAKYLHDCVQLYLSSPYGIDPSSHTDEALCYSNLCRVANDSAYIVLGAFRDDVMQAFMLIRKGTCNLHSSDFVFLQEYYVTSLTGFSAARVLIAMHTAMEMLAVKAGATSVKSHCSHLDHDQILCKILEKAGWSRCGYVVYKMLREKAPSARKTIAG